MSDTLKIWDAVRKIDPKYTKQVSDAGKQHFTNIDAYYLIERSTETFGSMGKGFGLKDLHMDEVHLGDTILVKLKAVFFYPAGEFPIYNAMKLLYKTQKGYERVDEDVYKKLITNTLSKALSYLGFGADVYMGKFEDAAYVQEVAQEFANEEYYSYLHTIKAYIERSEHKEKVTAWVLERARAESIEVIPFESAKEIAKLIEQKQKRATHDNTGA